MDLYWDIGSNRRAMTYNEQLRIMERELLAPLQDMIIDKLLKEQEREKAMKELDRQIEVMKAYGEGRLIEWRLLGSLDWNGCGVPTSRFNWDRYDYRIKPEPEYIPLTKDDLPDVCWIRWIDKKTASEYLVFAKGATNIAISPSLNGETSYSYTYEQLFRLCEYKVNGEWKPCKKEKV